MRKVLQGLALAVIVAAMPRPTLADEATDACLLKALREAPDSRPVGLLRESCRTTSPSDQATQDESLGPGEPDAPSAVPLANGSAGQLGKAETPARLPDLGDDPDLQNAVGIEAFGFLPHRPNYLLPAAYGRGFSRPAVSSKSTEIEFQVSLKLPFSLPELRGQPDAPVVYFAYTGSAWWQAYETKRSSPFREYNHAPELFLQVPIRQGIAGWRIEHAQFGFEHHSNGRTSLESRSWNRLFAQMDMTRDSSYWVKLRTWWRLPESAKTAAGESDGDDNPDITDYYGRGELRFGHRSRGLSWNMMLRRDFRGKGKGAAEFNLSYPTRFNPRARWTIRLFDGYGESLIDYDRRVQRIGLGLMLSDWY